MFCQKCGNQIPDNAAVCPVCGNQMNTAVYAPPVTNVQPEPPKNNNTVLIITVVFLAVVAVVAIVFATLFATDTISFNKENETTVSDEEGGNKPAYKEPEIGTVLSMPVDTADKSSKKVMVKYDNFVAGPYSYNFIAADYTNPSEPIIYYEMSDDNVTYTYAFIGDTMYVKSEILPTDETYKSSGDSDYVEMSSTFSMYLGHGDADYVSEIFDGFKYVGKENLPGSGEAFVYEIINNTDNETKVKCWVDVDTGVWVRAESEGEIFYEVTEIITGDDVDLPEFDFENAISAE